MKEAEQDNLTRLASSYRDLGLAPDASLSAVHVAFRAQMWRMSGEGAISRGAADQAQPARLVAAYLAILDARRPLALEWSRPVGARPSQVARGLTGFILLGIGCLLATVVFQSVPSVMLVVLALLLAGYGWWYRTQRRRE
jgi:hypothetical protein